MKLKKLIGYALIGVGCVSLTACHDLYVEDGYYEGGYHHGGHPPPPPHDSHHHPHPQHNGGPHGPQTGPASQGPGHHAPGPAPRSGNAPGLHGPQAGPTPHAGNAPGPKGGMQGRPAEHGSIGKASGHRPSQHRTSSRVPHKHR